MSPRKTFLKSTLCATLAFLSTSQGCMRPASISGGSRGELRPSPRAKADRVIVFIHGVFGDTVGTWTNAKTHRSFPGLIQADTSLPPFDIYMVGYDSPLLWRSLGLEEVAEAVRERIWEDGIFNNYKEVYFISHSMGGLIALRIFQSLTAFYNVPAREKVRAMIFFSTPANGATIAEYGQYISANPQLKGMDPIRLNEYLQAIQNDLDQFRDARDTLGLRWPGMFVAYENASIGGGLGPHVVDRVYASMSHDGPMAPFAADHSSIVKPEDETFAPYRWARLKLQQAASGTWMAAGVVETPRAHRLRISFEGSDSTEFSVTMLRTQICDWVKTGQAAPVVRPGDEGASQVVINGSVVSLPHTQHTGIGAARVSCAGGPAAPADIPTDTIPFSFVKKAGRGQVTLRSRAPLTFKVFDPEPGRDHYELVLRW